MKRKDIDKRKIEILDLYKENYPISYIAKLMNCDFDVIKRILQENKIDIRPLSFYIKGKPSWNKGLSYQKYFGERANQVIKNISEATKKVMENPKHRKRLSEIRNVGIREGVIPISSGKNHYLYNKNYEEIHGEKKAMEIKKKISKKIKGIIRSDRTKIKTSVTKQGITLEEWKGFVSSEPYDQKWTNKFKQAIRKRDNQICMLCGVHREKLNNALDVHHIDYNKKMSLPQNCISLCNKCHGLTNSNREHWQKLFQERMFKFYNYKYSENGEIKLELKSNIK